MDTKNGNQPQKTESRLLMADQSTKSAHTPGPWAISPKGGAIVASAPTGHDSEDNTKYYGGSLICESVAWESNARLIAAAPEMLAMLYRCEMWLSTHPEGRAMMLAVRAEIAKATGGPIRATDSEIKEELRNEIQTSGDC